MNVILEDLLRVNHYSKTPKASLPGLRVQRIFNVHYETRAQWRDASQVSKDWANGSDSICSP